MAATPGAACSTRCTRTSARQPGDYHGFVATLDVYGFSLSPQQMSQACIWVSPFLYGDSKTHFYTLWTRDGTIGTGCYNTKCPGFQPEGGASIVPGAIIDTVTQIPNGVKQKLSLKLVKDSVSGDWLLHYGLNKDADELIGCFPKSIFTGLADKATAVHFGGAVVAGGGQSLVPMGSGFLPRSSDAASFTNVQLIDPSVQASLVTWQLARVMTDSNLYPTTTIAKPSPMGAPHNDILVDPSILLQNKIIMYSIVLVV
ncbi:hypothetical protein BS78_02G115200 [Paspalum vaginatum]|nr:hypothetical protein BS78_02G115200 [Paspalum vaginatum]